MHTVPNKCTRVKLSGIHPYAWVEICVFAVSFYQIIKAVLPLETDEYKIKSFVVFLITRRGRNFTKEKEAKEAQRTPERYRCAERHGVNQFRWMVWNRRFYNFVPCQKPVINQSKTVCSKSGDRSIKCTCITN